MTSRSEPYDHPAIVAFALALTAWREARGMTKSELAQVTGFVPQLIGQLEGCKNIPSPRVAGDLDTVFGTEQFSKLEKLLTKTRHMINLPPGFTAYAELEREAREVWMFEPLIVPGPFQAEPYARALMGSLLSGERLDDAVSVRLSRKKLITGEDGAHAFLVLDEWVLRRAIGTAEVMKEQLLHLLELAEHPRITIQILPADTEHYVAYSGAITLLTLDDRRVGYTEAGGHGHVIDDPGSVAGLSNRYDLLRGYALSVPQSRTMIRKAMEAL